MMSSVAHSIGSEDVSQDDGSAATMDRPDDQDQQEGVTWQIDFGTSQKPKKIPKFLKDREKSHTSGTEQIRRDVTPSRIPQPMKPSSKSRSEATPKTSAVKPKTSKTPKQVSKATGLATPPSPQATSPPSEKIRRSPAIKQLLFPFKTNRGVKSPSSEVKQRPKSATSSRTVPRSVSKATRPVSAKTSKELAKTSTSVNKLEQKQSPPATTKPTQFKAGSKVASICIEVYVLCFFSSL